MDTNQLRRNNEVSAREALIAVLPAGALSALDSRREFNATTKVVFAAAETIQSGAVLTRNELFRVHAKNGVDASQMKRDNEKGAVRLLGQLLSEIDWVSDNCDARELPSHNLSTKVMIAARAKISGMKGTPSEEFGGCIDMVNATADTDEAGTCRDQPNDVPIEFYRRDSALPWSAFMPYTPPATRVSPSVSTSERIEEVRQLEQVTKRLLARAKDLTCGDDNISDAMKKRLDMASDLIIDMIDVLEQ